MVRITALVENTSALPGVTAAHGLSLFIGVHGRRILFDAGPSGMLCRNADAMGIDLASVDSAVISHGHYDHGGALREFMSVNERAKIYVRRCAFGKYLSKGTGTLRYIGLDAELAGDWRIVFTENEADLGDSLTLFSGVCGRSHLSSMNGKLYEGSDGTVIPDRFLHEQSLVIRDTDGDVLVTGCSHAGIVNIVDEYRRRYGRSVPLTVVGGFHLYDVSGDRYEDESAILSLADALLETGAMYYTCHCTGEKAYLMMKERMGDRLAYLSAGTVIDVG